jgi:hypothetical protein
LQVENHDLLETTRQGATSRVFEKIKQQNKRQNHQDWHDVKIQERKHTGAEINKAAPEQHAAKRPRKRPRSDHPIEEVKPSEIKI